MPQLPFAVAPTIRRQIVSASIDGQECALEFPVFGSLKGRELIHIREHEYQSVVYRETARLADALVTEGMAEEEAQRLSIRVLSSRLGIPVALEAAEQRVMLRHAALIADISCVLQDEYLKQRTRTITAVIANRLAGCEEWTDLDSDNLPEPLQAAVFAFAESERSANQPQQSPEQAVEQMVETLGKLGPDTSQSPSTGPISTGGADSSGPMPPSSDQIVSETSPSITSSRRSKQENAG